MLCTQIIHSHFVKLDRHISHLQSLRTATQARVLLPRCHSPVLRMDLEGLSLFSLPTLLPPSVYFPRNRGAYSSEAEYLPGIHGALRIPYHCKQTNPPLLDKYNWPFLSLAASFLWHFEFWKCIGWLLTKLIVTIWLFLPFARLAWIFLSGSRFKHKPGTVFLPGMNIN